MDGPTDAPTLSPTRGTGALVACHSCDLLHERRPLIGGRKALCSRCGAVLYRSPRRSAERTLALALTGLVLFVLVNTFPFMTFDFEGRPQAAGFLNGAWELAGAGMWPLSVLIVVTCFAVPLVEMLGLVALLAPRVLGYSTRFRPGLSHLLAPLAPWAMLEICMLGALVALVKLTELAQVIIGVSFWSLAALIFVLAAARTNFDRSLMWDGARQDP